MEVNGVKVPFIPIGGVEVLKRDNVGVRIPEFDGKFDEILKSEIEKVKFSNHALRRLEERSIELSDEDLTLLNDAVSRAERKNTREVLILLRDIAFIVNVKNRTIVTVVDGESMREHIFTNIDGAVII